MADSPFKFNNLTFAFQIKQILAIWNPISDTRQHIDMFQKWKDILDNNDSRMVIPNGPSITVYERMVWEVWMPNVRRMVSNWNTKECDKIIGKSWSKYEILYWNYVKFSVLVHYTRITHTPLVCAHPDSYDRSLQLLTWNK